MHKDQKKLFDTALPCTTWGGQLEIISTHRGIETFFNKLCQEAEGENRREVSFYKIDIFTAVKAGFVKKLNMVRKAAGFKPFTPETFIEDCRAQCSDDQAFNQEYGCIPSSSADSLIPWDWIERAAGPNADYANGRSYMGVDVGRKRDLTDVWIIDKVNGRYRTVFCESYKDMPFDDQLERISALIKTYNVQKVCVDGSGTVGIPLAYRLELAFGKFKIESLTFTNPLKFELAGGVYNAFDRDLIQIPDDLKRKSALYAVHKVISSAGNTKFEAPTNADGHSDEFWSLALAIRAAGPPEVRKIEAHTIANRPDYDQQTDRQFYDEVGENNVAEILDGF